MSIAKFAVRRWAYRHERFDGRCFEIYEIATGKCASFPCTKKDGERVAKDWNKEAMENGSRQHENR